jgi:hypothetical protein
MPSNHHKSATLCIVFHCSAHTANLVAQHTAPANQFVSNPLQLVQDLGTLYNRSGKVKKLLSDSAAVLLTDFPYKPLTKTSRIRPLCPTRSLSRVSAVTSVLDQYAVVLASLETYASQVTDEAAAKACGLLNQLRQGKALKHLV